jgi:hypothetical protein
MAPSRSIETRLLEAVWTETINCFKDSVRTSIGEAAIGLDSTYSANGQYRIYARPFRKSESIVPYQIHMVPLPPKWEIGTGGVETTVYEIEVDFVFPFDLLNLVAGQTTFLDHIAAYRAWLAIGGSWNSKARGLKDPDNPTVEIAHLVAFVQDHWLLAPQTAGVIIPVILRFETREDKKGIVR